MQTKHVQGFPLVHALPCICRYKEQRSWLWAAKTYRSSCASVGPFCFTHNLPRPPLTNSAPTARATSARVVGSQSRYLEPVHSRTLCTQQDSNSDCWANMEAYVNHKIVHAMWDFYVVEVSRPSAL